MLSSPTTRYVALGLVLLWTLFQAFWKLGAANVTQDEQTYATAGVQYLHGDFALNREHPPFGKYLFGIAQLVGGEGVTQARVVVALALIAGGAVLFLWLRREIGWWGALLAAGTWWLAPHGGFGTRVDRTAILDPLMTFFMIAALAAAWTWMRRGTWWWAPLSGALMAMSVTSKVSTAVVLPAFLLLPILFRRWRALLVGGAMWVAAFGIVFVGLYLPMGIRSAIGYMLAFQHGQQVNGHAASIAGQIYLHSPWWANLWYLQRGATVPVLVVLVVGVVLAVVFRPDRLVAFVGAALACLLVFYLGVTRIALSTYYLPFLPLIVVLAAIGYARAARRWRAVTIPVGIAAAVVVGVGALSISGAVLREQPRGIALVGAQLARHDAGPGGVLFQSYPPFGFAPYYPAGTMDPAGGPFRAVVVGRDSRFPVDPRVSALLEDHRSDFTRVTVDDLQVWIPDRATIVLDADGALELQRR